ncbi:TPA: hypothetical protein QDB04_000209 [Burkholderia vietnamiensis]|nr:hypothetical protein [Burkholderia vietnamiensis]
MQTNLKQMKCGGCGGELFNLYTSDTSANIGLECQTPSCLSVSWVYPQPAKLDIQWGNRRDGEDSDGRVCVMD